MIKFIIQKLVNLIFFFSFKKKFRLQIYLKNIIENKYYKERINKKKYHFLCREFTLSKKI
jgi:hypothetical protein